MSRPSRARGLKLDLLIFRHDGMRSRPSRARGLKLEREANTRTMWWSRPSRARGLKPVPDDFFITHDRSRPSRARGLKRACDSRKGDGLQVAPFTGAWIETKQAHGDVFQRGRRALRRRVD